MRILVSAASRHEATFEVAQAIAKTLERADIAVDVRRPEEVGHLAAYDGVVLGSAIYAGHWLKAAKDLVERTSSRMRGIPVWLFSTGPIGDPLKPEGLPVDVAPMLEQSGAREHRIFGGRLDKRELGFGEKTVVRMVGAAEGDYRPWGEIEAWAEEIATTLKAAAPTDQPTSPPVPEKTSRRLERRLEAEDVRVERGCPGLVVDEQDQVRFHDRT